MSEPQSAFAQSIMEQKYSHDVDGRKETWAEIAHRVTREVMSVTPASDTHVKAIETMIRERQFLPGGRYLRSSGVRYHQVQNCLLLRAQDSREGWADLMRKATLALMTGAGIGVVYSDIRANGKLAKRTGGKSRGPIALMEMVNEAGRRIRSPGDRKAAIWAGLSWKHPDIFDFITVKNWSTDVHSLRSKNSDFPAPMDQTNVSITLDRDFFTAYEDGKHSLHKHAHSVYNLAVRQMLTTAEPGFSVDLGADAGEELRNACTEITSRDDSDICNLGSINLARVASFAEFTRIVDLATSFLLAGTVYSDVPYHEVDHVRTKNRRLGLGLMGLHEWLLQRGKKYGIDNELELWLRTYATSTEIAAKYAKEWDITCPVKTRAIAPTGTIGIVAETTTGIEPIFCVAYKRRYIKGDTTHYQYVIDPTAKRLIDSGVKPETIEDAYSLAADVERRVAFQAWVQRYVDHAISSTINLPAWGSEINNESTVEKYSKVFMRYLRSVRGLTVYPDGSRGGQPLTPVEYEMAAKAEGQVYVEGADICSIAKSGSCGE